MGIGRESSKLLRTPIPGLLLVGLLWVSASSAQTLEFKSEITRGKPERILIGGFESVDFLEPGD